jgi:hypothetical protein
MMWNDIHLLPFTVQFYKKRFSADYLQITIYDNESQDGSAELARALGCRVMTHSTSNEFKDGAHMRIKNECWKDSKADWVIVADMDEWVDIWPSDLTRWEELKVTTVQTRGMILVWPNDTMDLTEPVRGIWGDMADGGAKNYGKPCLFDRRSVTNIRTSVGGHTADFAGEVRWLSDVSPSASPPWLYHAKYFHPPYFIQRGKDYFRRMSDENKAEGWSTRYFVEPSVAEIENEFKSLRKQSLPLPGAQSSLF